MPTRKPKSVSKSALATDLQDHGVPIHSGSVMSSRTHRDPTTGKDYVYIGLNCSPSLLIQIDVVTGKSRQFDLPDQCSGPWGMAFTLDGDVLVTSVDGSLIRIDPRTGKLRVVAKFPAWLWTIDRGADGKYYMGSSPSGKLFYYDAVTEKSGQVADFSSVDKYARIVLGSPDGYLYCNIGCQASQVVAYHIASGKWKELLPSKERTPNFHHFSRSADGNIYVRTCPGNLYRLSHGEAFLLEESKNAPTPHSWGRPMALPDGTPVTPLDPDAIRIGEGENSRVIKYTYKTKGTGIFYMAAGPNDAVYGSTIMPLYLFRYTPAKKKLENLGRGGPDNGEAYSFGHVDGKLYYATYAQGMLMTYDPAKPLSDDEPGAMKWETNPKLISPLGAGHCRPRAMCVDSRKRVWVGSHAEYGKRHGGLFCYDTVTDKRHNNPIVIKDQSIQSLTADDAGELVFGGSDISRGSGMDPATKEAYLFAWDAQTQKMKWKLIPVAGENGIINLLHHKGKIYGTTRPKFTFFCFDVATKKMDYVIESKISACREQSMAMGPDGFIYGITWTSLFRWHLANGKIEVLYDTTQKQRDGYSGGSLFHKGAVIVRDRLYFTCGEYVMSLKLPI